MNRTADIAIIGAGPYGLSISAHLRGRGIAHEIFGRPMGSWRDHMPNKMVLRSEALASNLWDPQGQYTLERYFREKGIPYKASGPPTPIGRFLDYTDWFQKRAVPDVQDLQVQRLAQADDGFILDLSNGDALRARNVIVAAGHRYFHNVPAVLRELPRELLSHSGDHSDFTPLVGKDVVVIGAGQSALETAALLHEQGTRVRLLVRESDVIWNAVNLGEARSLIEKIRSPESGLGFGWRSVAASEFPQVFHTMPRAFRNYVVARTWGPSGAWWLKERIVGKVPVLASHEVVSAAEANGKARLVVRTPACSDEVEADHVIAATGFRADLSRLPFLDPALAARITAFDGVPELSRSFESSVPGLHFVGLLSAPSFGPVMRFMFGAKHVAPVLARRFGATSAARAPMPVGATARG